jgi:hypothetical protein
MAVEMCGGITVVMCDGITVEMCDGITKEPTIRERVQELFDLLNMLDAKIDNLVHRNPDNVKVEGVECSPRADNVFDEIADNLVACKETVMRITDKVDIRIAQKVH